jgi:hypothetical protein
MVTTDSSAPPAHRTPDKNTRAGAPFAAAGARLLNLLAATIGDDACCECGIPLDTLSGEGLPHRRSGWICAECAEQRSYS